MTTTTTTTNNNNNSNNNVHHMSMDPKETSRSSSSYRRIIRPRSPTTSCTSFSTTSSIADGCSRREEDDADNEPPPPINNNNNNNYDGHSEPCRKRGRLLGVSVPDTNDCRHMDTDSIMTIPLPQPDEILVEVRYIAYERERVSSSELQFVDAFFFTIDICHSQSFLFFIHSLTFFFRRWFVRDNKHHKMW